MVDSNFFIQALRNSYPLDVFPIFRDKIKDLALNDEIINIDKVQDEITEHEDRLSSWIETNLPESFFKETDNDEILTEYARVSRWAESKSHHYKRRAIDEFLEYNRADAWLLRCLMKI